MSTIGSINQFHPPRSDKQEGDASPEDDRAGETTTPDHPLDVRSNDAKGGETIWLARMGLEITFQCSTFVRRTERLRDVRRGRMAAAKEDERRRNFEKIYHLVRKVRHVSDLVRTSENYDLE